MDRGRVLLAFLLLTVVLPEAVMAEFLIERVDVTISDIQSNGKVKVRESIKMIIKGEYSQALYDSGYGGYSNNDLSFWSTTTGLKDVKRHINPSKVNIEEFTLTPQPRGKCNPLQEICHGELIFEYYASPSYNTSDGTGIPVEGTGVLNVDNYKPRTTSYFLNPGALSFTTTEQGNIILDEYVYFTVEFPEGTVITKLNPFPEDVETDLPVRVSQLTWNDMVLVKFTLEFEVEGSLEREVTEFFFGFVQALQRGLGGEYGFAIVLLAVIIVGGYLYIRTAKRKKEE